MKKISFLSVLAVGAIAAGVYLAYKKGLFKKEAGKKDATATGSTGTGSSATGSTETGSSATGSSGTGSSGTTGSNVNTNIAPSNAIELTTAEKGTILKKGSSGTLVKILQTFLNFKEPANPLTIDGNFGELTEKKLIEVQNYTTRSLGALLITKYNPNNFIGYTLFNTRAV